jgi:16S rRNA (adenine1518-N6/adenine1519-N6)-dimethyltransferase
MSVDLFQITELKNLLRRFNIQPRREQGQHFLIDRGVRDAIVKASGVSPTDDVLEIGPGVGSLTEALVKRARRVVAVELDRQLAGYLRGRFESSQNCTIVQDDARTVNLAALGLRDRQYRLIANLPYTITSYAIQHALTQDPRPSAITLVIQREVAERIVAPAGGKSVLTISVDFFADARIIQIIPPAAFWPIPAVHSALITITPRAVDPAIDEAAFFRVVKAGYSSRRKKLRNSLAAGLQREVHDIDIILEKAAISSSARAQELTVKDWLRIVDKIV